MQRITALFVILFGFLAFTGLGCAYRMGTPERTLPGGFRYVHIPMFKNLTQEVGIEVYFSRALVGELERSGVAQVSPNQAADVLVQGVIESVQYIPGGKRTSEDLSTLPRGTVLATQYRILVTSTVNIVKQSDGSVLWTGRFNGERTYSAPQIASAVINSANPLYNLSARRKNIEEMAIDMMSEAHDRMTENF